MNVTIQTKRIMEIDDIVGFRFECGCGSVFIVPVSDFRTMPTACHNCGEQFADYHTKLVQDTFQDLITQFRKIKRITESRKFKFAFEITPEITPS